MLDDVRIIRGWLWWQADKVTRSLWHQLWVLSVVRGRPPIRRSGCRLYWPIRGHRWAVWVGAVISVRTGDPISQFCQIQFYLQRWYLNLLHASPNVIDGIEGQGNDRATKCQKQWFAQNKNNLKMCHFISPQTGIGLATSPWQIVQNCICQIVVSLLFSYSCTLNMSLISKSNLTLDKDSVSLKFHS